MKLPGIGPKTAVRLAFFVLDMKEDDVLGFAKALVNAKRDLAYCSVCGHITDRDPCYICNDSHRDQSVVCVVQEPKDVIAMEKMKEYQGSRSVICPHTEQYAKSRFAFTSAFAKPNTSSSFISNTKNANRTAVFGPIPGNFIKLSISFDIGSG